VAAASRLASFSLNQLEVSPGLVFIARDSKFRPSRRSISGAGHVSGEALARIRSILNENPHKINKADLCPPAHNGVVAGSSPAGPTKEISVLRQTTIFREFVRLIVAPREGLRLTLDFWVVSDALSSPAWARAMAVGLEHRRILDAEPPW
jgi:hypothetical protein